MAKRRAAALALATVLFVGLALPAHAQDVQAEMCIRDRASIY